MPFIKSADSARSKLHLTDTPLPVIAGILACAIAALLLAFGNVVSCAKGDAFVVSSSEDARSEKAVAGGPTGGLAASAASSASSGEAYASEAQPETTQTDVVVFVSGCVAAPGVYTLTSGSRVGDAVEAAGGFSEAAATDHENLARVLVDGEQIRIISSEEALAATPPSDVAAPSGGEGAAGQSSASSGLVDINQAGESELESLPGIGPSTAAKIIADRNANGPFASKEDLKRVSGIGDKKYAALADLITV